MTKIKSISFLATGNEIIQGDIQESNCNLFAKSIHSQGGAIFQHVQTSDAKIEMMAALHYLLQHSDAIIITGGLGPTSDDTTRFAIADVTNLPLEFNETAWQHIVTRLQSFKIAIAESNKQQALFPANAILYPNHNGTAFGCHLIWQNKFIFMLPGPPKECQPMFQQYVLPTLQKHDFFKQKMMHRWLTLGLIEGEIATEIDALAKPYPVETAYRWNYPYLEIKLSSTSAKDISALTQQITQRLANHLVSTTNQNAFEILQTLLPQMKQPIYIFDETSLAKACQDMIHSQLYFIEKPIAREELTLHVICSDPLATANLLNLHIKGFQKNLLAYQHTIAIPNRGPEVSDYIKCYIAWQLSQFILKSQSK